MSTVTRNQLIVSMLVAGGLGLLVLFTALERNDGTSPTAEAVFDESLSPGDGLCLAESVDSARVASLVDGARLHARSAEVQAIEPGREFGRVLVSQDEAEAILAFDARFPTAPDGWSSQITLVGDSPKTPVHGRCEVRTKLENATVTREIVFPEHDLTLDTGETVKSPESRHLVTQGAQVIVRPHDEAEIVGEPAAKSLASANLQVRPHEYSAGVYWVEDGLGIGVTCFVMTAEECLSLAQSIK